MNNILNFYNFSLNEISKNSPIKELFKKENLGIIMLGLPGSGKSTFINNVILPINKNIKSFSTDYVSTKFTKDPNKDHVGSTELNIKYLTNYIQTGQNFIYDTTGANTKSIFDINKAAIKNGYDIIFILLLTDLETAKLRNKIRGKIGGHFVDEDYIDFVYSIQRQTTKDYIKLIRPKSFYIVTNFNGRYKYLKHTGDKILKRKVDKYL